MSYFITDSESASSTSSSRRPKTSYRRVSGLVSGHRYFSPGISRWLSRDPIGEMGSVSWLARRNIRSEALDIFHELLWLTRHEQMKIYVFVNNSTQSYFDALGESANSVPIVTFPITDPNANPCGPCTDGSTTGKKQKNKPILTNGCTFPKSMVPSGDPNNPRGNCSFRSSCDAHDTCFGTCDNSGSSSSSHRNTCDGNLRQNMYNACDRCFKNRDKVPAVGSEDKDYILCMLSAQAAYNWVNGAFGSGFYLLAQSEACESCDCCPAPSVKPPPSPPPFYLL